MDQVVPADQVGRVDPVGRVGRVGRVDPIIQVAPAVLAGQAVPAVVLAIPVDPVAGRVGQAVARGTPLPLRHRTWVGVGSIKAGSTINRSTTTATG